MRTKVLPVRSSSRVQALLSLVAIFGLFLAACSPQTTPPPTEVLPQTGGEGGAAAVEEPTEVPTVVPTDELTSAPQTIVDIAAADGRFTTLVQAVQAAGLADTLSGPGPFTVFAPTDEAFAGLPEGTLEGLLANPDSLREILLYHVVEGKVMAADAAGLEEAQTVSGQALRISAEDGQVMINDSQVILPDIEASNGVIHVIDSVLLPEGQATLVDAAVADGRFTTLATAIEAAGLVETLQGEGPFTVFAPTDEAFAKLPAGTLDELLKPENAEQLRNLLLYHVVEGKVMAADVAALEEAETLSGGSIQISAEGDGVLINDANIVTADLETSNGVIHVIDSVLMPKADIVDTAVADGRFTTLVQAIEAAGLVEALKADGPFTVFAPTDEAFASLPAGTLETLLQPENVEQLRNILLYHVVESEVLASDVVNLESADTLLGQPVAIEVRDGKVFLNDAEVIITDIQTSNGVIHVIDAVLLPE
jgi:transforming growth factor-beta-induced protein